MRFALLLFALLSLTASAQRAPRKAAKKPAATAPVLVFQRTPCHGTCPAYSATAYADGRVVYEGERYVPNLGRREVRLRAAQIAALLAEAQRLGFAKLPASYAPDNHTYDLPSTIITVRPANQPAHTVEVRGGEPPAALTTFIAHLQARFDEVAGLSAEQ